MARVTIDAGQLNRPVIIQTRGVSKNEVGENVAGWQDFVTVWAKCQPLRGQEYLAAGQMQQTTDVRFRMRYRSDITQSMRVVWNGTPYDIVDVINVDGANVATELMAVTGKRDGR